ncbi:hypothetical protein Tco_1550461 [Tanacetum coccineum]
MPHLLLSHLTMSRSPILRRTRRRMTMRTPRRILSIILPMEEMTAMARRGHQRMIRMMIIDIEADDEEEEEEHLAPADSVVVALPVTDQALSAEETEPFETDESVSTYRVTARISILAPVPTPVWSDAEVARLLVISTPPSSPFSPWSLPLPQIPSPSLPLSPPSLVLSPAPYPSPIRSLGYRAAMIRMIAEAASTSHSLPLPPPFILSPTRPDAPPPLPTSSPTSLTPLLLPSASPPPPLLLDQLEVLGQITALLPLWTGRSGVTRRDMLDMGSRIREIRLLRPYSTDTDLGAHVREFESMVRRDTDEIYTRLDDEQSQRQLLAGRLNMLFRDRRAHARTARLLETEARMSREAWG